MVQPPDAENRTSGGVGGVAGRKSCHPDPIVPAAPDGAKGIVNPLAIYPYFKLQLVLQLSLESGGLDDFELYS